MQKFTQDPAHDYNQVSLTLKLMFCPVLVSSLHISQSMLSSTSNKLALHCKPLTEQLLPTTFVYSRGPHGVRTGRRNTLAFLPIRASADTEKRDGHHRSTGEESPDCSHFLSFASHMASGLLLRPRFPWENIKAPSSKQISAPICQCGQVKSNRSASREPEESWWGPLSTLPPPLTPHGCLLLFLLLQPELALLLSLASAVLFSPT